MSASTHNCRPGATPPRSRAAEWRWLHKHRSRTCESAPEHKTVGEVAGASSHSRCCALGASAEAAVAADRPRPCESVCMYTCLPVCLLLHMGASLSGGLCVCVCVCLCQSARARLLLPPPTYIQGNGLLAGSTMCVCVRVRCMLFGYANKVLCDLLSI